MLAVLDPSGRAGSDERQSATLLNASDELGRLLDDGQVSGHVHVVHTLKAQRLDCRDHLAFHIGSRLVAEALADLGAHGRSSADQDVLLGISQRLKHLIGIVTLIECAHGAGNDALSAVDAGGGLQRRFKRRGDVRIKAAVIGTDNADALDLLADCHAAPAKNALVVIPDDRRLIINFVVIHDALEPALGHAVLAAQSLQFAVGAADALQALLVVIGKQQLQIHFAGIDDAGRIGFDFHPLGAGVYAGSHQPERLSALRHLHQTQPAGADLIDILQVAQGGDIDLRRLGGFENRGPLGNGIGSAVYFDVQSFHSTTILLS